MENHIPQAVINRAELFFESKTKYSIILLGEYKNKTAYYVSYGASNIERSCGSPVVILYDSTSCEIAIDSFKVLDYFR